MKLQPSKEPRPTRARAQDVVRPEVEPSSESPIPWEAMAERFKPRFIEFIDRADNSDALTNVHAILLLFPELAQRLHFTQEQFADFASSLAEPSAFSYYAELLEIFPDHHEQLHELEGPAFRQVEEDLRQAAEEPAHYEKILDLVCLMPQYFKQYQELLTRGIGALLESVNAVTRPYGKLEQMADLVLFFPDLRPQVQQMLAQNKTEIMQGFRDWMIDQGDGLGPDIHALAWGLARLKIIYADSAGYRPDGRIFIEDKKPPLPQKPPLPPRDLAA